MHLHDTRRCAYDRLPLAAHARSNAHVIRGNRLRMSAVTPGSSARLPISACVASLVRAPPPNTNSTARHKTEHYLPKRVDAD
ncbi:hypothetical protein [Burkholderia sp. FL-7-2-10-S1-D7]|uniref:hypothetical protein n=1 Tax=Burkholderia sp. FL-7-2-10-S1-D7 TaxID=1637866 RepID=UPI0012E3C912|nr:hypothetical protein [Burkholderia sp. FL-7-2-10-S1-D7]